MSQQFAKEKKKKPFNEIDERLELCHFVLIDR